MENAKEPYFKFLYFASLLVTFKSHEWFDFIVQNRFISITIAAAILYLVVKVVDKYVSGWLQKVCERFNIR